MYPIFHKFNYLFCFETDTHNILMGQLITIIPTIICQIQIISYRRYCKCKENLKTYFCMRHFSYQIILNKVFWHCSKRFQSYPQCSWKYCFKWRTDGMHPKQFQYRTVVAPWFCCELARSRWCETQRTDDRKLYWWYQ